MYLLLVRTIGFTWEEESNRFHFISTFILLILVCYYIYSHQNMSDLGLPFGLTLIPWDVSTWPLHIIIIYTIVIIAAMEGIAQSIHIIWHACDRIAVKGKHLDSLSALDIGFIIFNKLSTAVFTYHLIQIIYYTSSIKKLPSEVTIANTIGSMICFIAFYDLFYHVCYVWSIFLLYVSSNITLHCRHSIGSSILDLCTGWFISTTTSKRPHLVAT